MSSQELVFLPDSFTPTQQKFADFINERVKPVEKTVDFQSDHQEASFSVEPTGLVPVDTIDLEKYTAHGMRYGRYAKPIYESYNHYIATMKNSQYETGTSLWLCVKNGFRYRTARHGFYKAMRDNAAAPIVEALLENDL